MDRYFLDKRVVKKTFLKYGIMFLIALPLLIVFNVFCDQIGFWWTVVVDMCIIGFVVVIGELLLIKIKNKREAKQQELDEEKRRLAKEVLKKHKQEKK